MSGRGEGLGTGTRPLREALRGDLTWRRPGWLRRELILEAGSERLARLSWPRWYSFEAAAESGDGRWTLGRPRGWSLHGGCLVRDAASGVEVATFRRNWRGKGTARFVSGAQYAWAWEGFWRPRYFWADGGMKPLLTFRTLFSFGRSYEMTADPAARALAELPVLVLLGGYVMAMISAQASAS